MNETALVPMAGTNGAVMTREEAEATATFMANEYHEATAEIRRLMLAIQEQTVRLGAAFRTDDDEYGPGFRIDFHHNGHREQAETPDRIFADMTRKCWRILIDKLGIKNVMSVKQRNEFDSQLEHGELPEITAAAILSMLYGLADQAKTFAQEAAVEVFKILRPSGHWGGQYKTNDAFRVGKRVILTWRVERCYNGRQFRVQYNRCQEITAIDGVFHLLDGKGVMRENRGPLVNAIEASPDGRGETAYFKFKCFKNRNLHLEMKRLDLVQDLNFHASGERVLGDDMTE